ncbi:MAG: hypothetical protein U0841_05840 [Chloroflexia bacterium]
MVGTPGLSFTDPLGAAGTGLPQTLEAGYTGGKYRIAPSGTNRASWATYTGIYTNVRVEATTQFSGSSPGAAGIIFWLASPDDYYLFAVSRDGFYQVAHYQGGTWTALTLAQRPGDRRRWPQPPASGDRRGEDHRQRQRHATRHGQRTGRRRQRRPARRHLRPTRHRRRLHRCRGERKPIEC